MAFTTTQTMDNALLRGLQFRLPNNAPISSLYSLYANGQGATYWSNSVNPTDLSTLSTAIGHTNSTIQFQSSQISTLFGLEYGLSTNASIFSNAIISSVNSTILAYSSISSYIFIVEDVNKALQAGLSTVSTASGIQNISTYSTLTTNLNANISTATNSSIAYTNMQLSTVAGQTSTQVRLLSTSVGNALANLSTSTGNKFSTNTGLFSTNLYLIGSSFISTMNVTNSTINGLALRTANLETLSTNQSSITFNWISSANVQNNRILTSTFNAAILPLSTAVSTLINTTNFLSTSYNTLSTFTYSNIAALTAGFAQQSTTIYDLQFEFSTITTSSILAGIYLTFFQLEEFTSTLVGSTINTINPTLSTIYTSTIQQNNSIATSFYSSFFSSLFYAAVSSVIPSTYSYMSTLITTLNSTGIALVYSTTTSTAIGLNASLFNSSILGYISTPAGQQISTTSSQTAAILNGLSTSSSASVSTTTGQSASSLNTITNSTITAYNTFIAGLNASVSTSLASTLYTEQVINLTSNAYSGQMDIVNNRNFYINVFNLNSNTNSNYMVYYDSNGISAIDYRQGVISLNVSTLGYAGSNHSFVFDVYQYGVPTSVWGAFYPGIVNYNYLSQYSYTIKSGILYTNLLGVYPVLDVTNFSFTSISNVFIGSNNSPANNTFWYSTPMTFTWSNYNGFPSNYGGPPFNPQIVCAIYQGANLLTNQQVDFGTSTITLNVPFVPSTIATGLKAQIYVAGKRANGFSYDFTAVNSRFDTITLCNVANTPNGLGYSFIGGNELVVRTRKGAYPLKNVVPVNSSFGNGAYYNESMYSTSNLTNGILNVFGTSPSSIYTSVYPAPVIGLTNGQMYQTTSAGNIQIYFNPNDTQLSTILAVGNTIGQNLYYTLQNVSGTSTSGKFLGRVIDTTLSGNPVKRLDSLNPVTGFSELFTTSGLVANLVPEYILPTTLSTTTYVQQQNFIGVQNSNMQYNATWGPQYGSMLAYFIFQNNMGNYIDSGYFTSLVGPTPVFTTSSKVDTYSLRFNGTNVGYRAANPILTNSITMAGWFYQGGEGTTPFDGTIMSMGSNNNNVLRLRFTNDVNVVRFEASVGGVFDFVVPSAPALSNGQWNFVAATLNATTSTMSVYLNGSSGTTTNIVNKLSNVPLVSSFVGNSYDAGSYFNGYIDELAIWNVALTPQEISTIYGTQRSPFAVPQVLRYNLRIPNDDTIEEMGFYNLYWSSPVTSYFPSTAIASTLLTVSVSSGTTIYRSTMTLTGAQAAVYQF